MLLLGTGTALPYLLYIQPSVRVIFITTDVIEMLMVGGTRNQENFHPTQIGKLFLYMQTVLGILRTLVPISLIFYQL